jgi:EpsD family peptidyl-prolyl cis-trans isomerase
MTLRAWFLLFGFLVALSLAACERPVEARPGATVAARVNGAEVTLHQPGEPGTRSREPSQSAAQALESLIDREVLAQRAIEQRLDRDPDVVRAAENARRQVLAQAYLERLGARLAGPTAEEIAVFYRGNPALFAERRIYQLRELALGEAGSQELSALEAHAARARALEEIAAALAARNAKFTLATVTHAAEHLPLAMLEAVARMKPGEIAVVAAPPGASVVQLVHAHPAPLAEEQAAPLIERFLAGRKRLELAAAEVRRLREAARIEYVGDFKAR